MENIFIMPTDGKSNLFEFGGELNITDIPQENFRSQYIYITSTNSIEDGEYGLVYSLFNETFNESFKHDQIVFYMDSEQRQSMESLGGQKIAQVLKVELTNDPTLIADGVNEIPLELLELIVSIPFADFNTKHRSGIAIDYDIDNKFFNYLSKIEEMALEKYPPEMMWGMDLNEQVRTAFVEGYKLGKK